MTKDIKEFLPLYLGQKVQVNKGLTEAPECYLRGNYTVDKDGFNVERYQIFTEPGNNIHWLEESEFKLILRPLSSMTEEEKKGLWRLIFSMGHGNEYNDRFKEFTGSIRIINESSYYNVPREVMCQGVERLGIESDGTIWADCWADCDLHNWRHNQHEVTRWLLSKGFDLFNLIPEGLALDITTLKN